MKFKKYSYLLVLILMLSIGINEVYGLTCNQLFDESLRNLINEILLYPKVIVPIVVIVLGIVDLAKATLAAKEDEMRKAQATFIKRIIIGVVVFFIPTIVDFIMVAANQVWNALGYQGCDFSSLIK